MFSGWLTVVEFDTNEGGGRGVKTMGAVLNCLLLFNEGDYM